MTVNPKKIQIVSLPRSGSTILYFSVMAGTRIGRPTTFNSFSTEPFNFVHDIQKQKNIDDDFLFRLNAIHHADQCVIKIQIGNLYSLEVHKPRLIFEYIKKTQDMYNIFLIRKNIVENVLSHCLAIKTNNWVNNKDIDHHEVYLNNKEIANVVPFIIQDYELLYKNPYCIDVHEMLTYEDFIVNKSSKEIFENTKLFTHYDSHNIYSIDNVLPFPDKNKIIKNIDNAKELIRFNIRKTINKKNLPFCLTENDYLELI